MDVITSYSIHYTKLYEGGDVRARSGRAQGAGGGGGAEQDAGLPPVDAFECLEADGRVGGQDVFRLARHQAVQADGIAVERGQSRGQRPVVGTGEVAVRLVSYNFV